MSKDIYNPILPTHVVGHPTMLINDADRMERQSEKVWRMIINLPLNFTGTGQLLAIYDGLPTLYELMDMIADPTFDYDTDCSAFTEAYALAEFFIMDEGVNLPDNFPEQFSFLLDFTMEEKVALVRSSWRTRNMHGMLPQFFAAIQLIIIFAMRDLFVILAGKFRKINATVSSDSKIQIPYSIYDSRTWKSELYRQFFVIDTIYTATERDNMIQHLFATFDSFGFKLPSESIKLAKMLYGKFENPIFNDNLEIIGTHPVDLILHEPTYDDLIFGDDWTEIHLWLTKLQPYLDTAFLVYDKIEYNDKFYKNSFGDFKSMMDSVQLTSSILCEWDTLPIPWFHIYFGLHYDDVSLRHEFIFRAWNGTFDGMPDLDDGNLPGGCENMFVRQFAGLGRNENTTVLYMHALQPYGYDFAQWKQALVYGWSFLMHRMGYEQLTDDLEIDYDFEDVISMCTYYSYYDKQTNEMCYVINDMDVIPAGDTLTGMFATGDRTNNQILSNPFTPRVMTSNAYNTIADDYTMFLLDDDVPLVNNMDELFTRLKHIYGYIEIEASFFQSVFTKEQLYMILNPNIAKPVAKQIESVDKIETKLKEEEVKTEEKQQTDKKLDIPSKNVKEIIVNNPLADKKPSSIVTKDLETTDDKKPVEAIIKEVDAKVSKKTGNEPEED